MKNINVCILNYGSGNINSVYNIISYLKYKVVISNTVDDIKKSTHIILPGVGAFGSAMKKINKTIPLDVLEEEVLSKKKPFLGICVGMQVLAEKGFEFGNNDGLGWIKGNVIKFNVENLNLPHVGWNDIKIKKDSPIFNNLNNIRDFYFVHSYVFDVRDKELIISETNYGNSFCSCVQSENIFGVQFHPEKSQRAGQLLLKNFLDLK